MKNDILKALITEEELHSKVAELGKKISEDYRDKNLLMVSVLKGSVVFMADLMREVTIPCEIDFMCVSSYGSGVKTSGVVKIVMNYVLVGNPDINIHGAPISTLCCYLVISGLNLFFVWKYSPQKPHYLQLFTKPVIASVLMGGAAWAVYGFVDRALSGGHSAYSANALAVLFGIAAGVVVYFILVIALRILRAEDVKGIPYGARIIKLLHLK